jgi:cell division protein YceG involved in septum cleavage
MREDMYRDINYRMDRVYSRNSVRTASRNNYYTITIIAPLLILFAIMISLVFFISGSVKTSAQPVEPSYKYYTSIRVEKGDTLWNIANEYISDDYSDIQEYIDEVCSINHISENEIHAGEYITVPYYSSQYLE